MALYVRNVRNVGVPHDCFFRFLCAGYSIELTLKMVASDILKKASELTGTFRIT